MNKLVLLDNNPLYIKSLDIVKNKIGIDKFEIISNSESLIAFKYNHIDRYNFEIVFWLNENRISLNIEDWYEIIDSYLVDEKEAFEVFEFIDTIFKNEVLIENYCTEKSNNTYKRNLVYIGKIDNSIRKINNPKKLNFKFPWVKEKLYKTEKFKPLY